MYFYFKKSKIYLNILLIIKNRYFCNNGCIYPSSSIFCLYVRSLEYNIFIFEKSKLHGKLLHCSFLFNNTFSAFF